MLAESRQLAKLLLTNPTQAEYLYALKIDNILQKKTPSTALRQANLIRKRLECLDGPAWKMIAQSEQEVAIQMLLVGAIKHSRLLGDFMHDVLAGQNRRLEQNLSLAAWEDFIIQCEQRDAEVSSWSSGTKAKLLQVIVRILSEAKYIESSRSLKLTPPMLHPEVERYLRGHFDDSILSIMELKV